MTVRELIKLLKKHPGYLNTVITAQHCPIKGIYFEQDIWGDTYINLHDNRTYKERDEGDIKEVLYEEKKS